MERIHCNNEAEASKESHVKKKKDIDKQKAFKSKPCNS